VRCSTRAYPSAPNDETKSDVKTLVALFDFPFFTDTRPGSRTLTMVMFLISSILASSYCFFNSTNAVGCTCTSRSRSSYCISDRTSRSTPNLGGQVLRTVCYFHESPSRVSFSHCASCTFDIRLQSRKNILAILEKVKQTFLGNGFLSLHPWNDQQGVFVYSR
jgi:hypothetical protein